MIGTRFRATNGHRARQHDARQEAETAPPLPIRKRRKRVTPHRRCPFAAFWLRTDRQTEIRNQFLWAIRTAGAAAKRGWRTLVRVRQDGFSPAHIGRAAGSQPRAHTLRVTDICPALRSPRTQGAAAFAANAATNANQKYNRDRVDSSPLPFPIPAGNHAFKPETAR